MNVGGGCHCGAVRFSVVVPERVELLDCNCSICAKTGFVHLIVARGDFTLLGGSDALTPYRFGSGMAEHLFCAMCGVKSFYRPRSHPEGWSVNWHCLDDGHGLVGTRRAFDGRNWEAARLALAATQPVARAASPLRETE